MMQDPIAPEGDDEDDAHEDESDTSASPRDFLLSGLGDGAPPPTILDPVDGLPRPKDEGFVQNAVPAATDENLVCQEGGAWVVSGGRTPDTEQPDESKLRLVHAYRHDNGDTRLYRETTDTSAHPTEWCRARPACAHYAELETMVTEFVLEGHDKAPQTILRKCTKLDLILTDSVLRGCNLREPRDLVSEQRLIDRAREKAQQAKEGAIAMFREARPEEQVPAVDPAKATTVTAVEVFTSKKKGKAPRAPGTLCFYRPSHPATAVVQTSPLYVFFPDEAWQPPAETYHGLVYTDVTGKRRVWSASLSGELLIRMSPGVADDETPDDLGGIRQMQWTSHMKAIAKALVEHRRDVAVVAYSLRTQIAVRRDVKHEMDALGYRHVEPFEHAPGAPKKAPPAPKKAKLKSRGPHLKKQAAKALPKKKKTTR